MYYTTTQVCTAHISVNKNRVKIYKEVKGLHDHTPSVFLKDGQNFEIELYNPKQNSVLAKISINGKDISSAGFILRPGQRVFIERFIDEAKKFTFSTYEVENTSENQNAIAKNGEVEVRFYDEYAPFSFGGTTINTVYPTFTTTPNYIYSGNVGIGTSSPNSTLTIRGTSTGTFYSNTNSTFTNSVSMSVAGSLETGRVERGGSSDQSFSSASGNFNSYASSTETIKIYPAFQKPVETSEIRNYCTNCGTRAKKTGWKFCPSCGSKF
jgi:hypothetical protein